MAIGIGGYICHPYVIATCHGLSNGNESIGIQSTKPAQWLSGLHLWCSKTPKGMFAWCIIIDVWAQNGICDETLYNFNGAS